MAFPTFAPALRTVNAGGTEVIAPVILYQPNSNGIILRSGTPEYVPEMLGPWMDLTWTVRWRLLGYRLQVPLSFGLLAPEASTGLAKIRGLYVAGAVSETFAALQFAAWYIPAGGTTWVGVRPTGSWAPRPAQGKQGVGWELEMPLESTALLSSPGDWSGSAI